MLEFSLEIKIAKEGIFSPQKMDIDRKYATLSCSTVRCKSNRRSERVSGETTKTLTILDIDIERKEVRSVFLKENAKSITFSTRTFQ